MSEDPRLSQDPGDAVALREDLHALADGAHLPPVDLAAVRRESDRRRRRARRGQALLGILVLAALVGLSLPLLHRGGSDSLATVTTAAPTGSPSARPPSASSPRSGNVVPVDALLRIADEQAHEHDGTAPVVRAAYVTSPTSTPTPPDHPLQWKLQISGSHYACGDGCNASDSARITQWLQISVDAPTLTVLNVVEGATRLLPLPLLAESTILRGPGAATNNLATPSAVRGSAAPPAVGSDVPVAQLLRIADEQARQQGGSAAAVTATRQDHLNLGRGADVWVLEISGSTYSCGASCDHVVPLPTHPYLTVQVEAGTLSVVGTALSDTRPIQTPQLPSVVLRSAATTPGS